MLINTFYVNLNTYFLSFVDLIRGITTCCKNFTTFLNTGFPQLMENCKKILNHFSWIFLYRVVIPLNLTQTQLGAKSPPEQNRINQIGKKVVRKKLYTQCVKFSIFFLCFSMGIWLMFDQLNGCDLPLSKFRQLFFKNCTNISDYFTLLHPQYHSQIDYRL